MEFLWTWGGKFFGYRERDNLWTYNGHHVGRFYGAEVYNPDGEYLGEIKSGRRLITNTNKKLRKRGLFAPYANRAGYAKYVDYVGYVMLAGYEDFSAPEDLV